MATKIILDGDHYDDDQKEEEISQLPYATPQVVSLKQATTIILLAKNRVGSKVSTERLQFIARTHKLMGKSHVKSRP